MPLRRERTGLRWAAGILTKKLYNLITFAGQRRIYPGLSPFFPTVFFRWNRFLHIYEVITTLVCLQKKLWSLSAAEQIAAPEGINMIGWLDDRRWVMYAAIFACIVCCTLYRCGLYPQLDRRFKSWATPENFLFAGYMGDRQTARPGNQSWHNIQNRRGFWINSLRREFEGRSQLRSFFVLGDSSGLLQSNRTRD